MSSPADSAGRLAGLVARLGGDDEHARYDAAYELHRLGRPALERALALAGDPDPRLREMACCVLGRIHDPQVGDQDPADPVYLRDGIPTLLVLLETDPAAAVRAAAAAALSFQLAPATLPALCRAAADPSSEVRFDAAFALGSFWDGSWEDPRAAHYRDDVARTLMRLMDDPDDDVRDWATFGIHQGSHDTPATRARLWRALEDPNADVRGEAAFGLARFGDRSLVPALDRLLREDPDIPSHYFQAAEELRDPALLPAVLAGAARWREGMEPGEDLHFAVRSALETLQDAARGPGFGPEERS